ncbi:hypothetical protein K438DRAFT_1860390 [Mycena galopus ATCC 62051]|nr:hypothetical protein K438DRAFT_1860390 [Mycena galopus ATCC 62051]
MTSTSALNDVLPSSVPSLKANGENFTIFSLRFLTSVDAKGYRGHFDGTEPKPTFGVMPLTATQVEEVALWEKAERNSKALLVQRVPDSIVVIISSMATVAEMWTYIDETFTSKGAYAQTNLRTEFLQSRCPAAGNVREFLENLTVRRETLATKYLADFAAGQLTFAKLHSTNGTIACGPFIHAISEEYDRKAGDRGKKPKGTCWNCGIKGHFSRDCRKPKKPKDEKDAAPSGKTSGSAAAVDWDSDEEGAWAVDVDSDYSSDWFSEVGEDAGDFAPDCGSSEELSGVDGSERSSFLDVDLDSDSVGSWDYVRDALDVRSELYDSGTTRHITPFRDEMTNFVEIPPKSFSANGVDVAKLHLTEVLYSPEVGYTLISIGRLDDAGITTTFSNGMCTMHGPDGEKIGEVPKNGRGRNGAASSYGAYCARHRP